MYILNTTYSVEKEVKESWLAWMRETFFVKATGTGLFTNPKIYRVMVDEEEQGPTFSVQMSAKTQDDVKIWLSGANKEMINDLRAKFGQKVLGFTTLLEEL